MDIKCVRRLIMIERRSFKVMLEWSTPSISDGDWIRKIIAESGNMGSDVSFANMYLLREKYDIRKKGIYLSDRLRQPGKSTASIKRGCKKTQGAAVLLSAHGRTKADVRGVFPGYICI